MVQVECYRVCRMKTDMICIVVVVFLFCPYILYYLLGIQHKLRVNFVHHEATKQNIQILHSLHLPEATTVATDDTVHIIGGTTSSIIINCAVKNKRIVFLLSKHTVLSSFSIRNKKNSIQKLFPLTDQLVNTAADTHTVSETVLEGKWVILSTRSKCCCLSTLQTIILPMLCY